MKAKRLLAFAILLLPCNAADQRQEDSRVSDDALPQILWRAPRNLTVQDWICGPDGCDQAPAPPFQFIKEDVSGTNPKISVRDSAGREWSVKFGAEAIPECFASRFVTALGYLAEPTYFVASMKVEGIQKLQRARWVARKDGTFIKGRFERRGQKNFVFLQGRQWPWANNRFSGSHELAGLKIVIMLLSNWDSKDARDGEDSNTAVFRVSDDGGRPVLFYGVFDWGASLGRWGGLLRRDQSDCAGYNVDTPEFVKGLGRNNEVEWGFSGKHEADLKRGITVDEVRWLLPYLQRITPEELHAGLNASGATERQTGCWARGIENRIQQLQAIANRH